jgi:hypothetical protein
LEPVVEHVGALVATLAGGQPLAELAVSGYV